jgi:hypothetical protein
MWNKEIAKYFQGKDFMNAPWLFAEAYKYRRLRECFSISKYWKVSLPSTNVSAPSSHGVNIFILFDVMRRFDLRGRLLPAGRLLFFSHDQEPASVLATLITHAYSASYSFRITTSSSDKSVILLLAQAKRSSSFRHASVTHGRRWKV